MDLTRIKYSFFIFLYLICAYSLIAQHPLYKNISVNEGLPSSSTYYVINDSKGYIWVASDLGLSKFNGRKFKNFSTTEGLKDNSVLCLAEDSKGNVWTASNNGSICFVKEDKIIEVPASEILVKTLKDVGGVITSIKFDSEDNLWIGTTRNLYSISRKENYTKIKLDNTFDNTPLCIANILDNNEVIISQNKNTKDKIKINGDLGSSFVQIKNKDILGKVLPILFSVKYGINPKATAVKIKDGTLLFSYMNELYSYKNGQVNALKTFESNILFLFEDKDSNLFVSLANGNGIQLFNDGNFSKSPLTLFYGRSIGSICQDFENGLWFTSTDKGLFYVPYLNSYQFPKYPQLCEGVNTVSRYDSLIIVVDSKNEIYTINTIDSIKKTDKLSEFNTGGKVGLCRLGDNFYYCGTITLEFSPYNFNIKNHKLNGVALSSNGIIETNKNEKIGLAYNELCYVENNTWKIISHLPERGTCIYFNKKTKSIWIGTKKGLYEYKDSVYRKIGHTILDEERIMYIADDIHGTIFVCTKNNGLFICKDNEWTNINAKNGLASNYCNHVNIDNDGIVWVSTNKGVNYFTLEKSSPISLINNNNGLNSNEILATATINDYLYAGTKLGLIKISKKQLNTKSTDSPISIKKEILSSHKNDTIINYSDSRIRIIVDCISYKQLYSQQFAYQLRGYNDSTNITSNEYIEFSNLPSGKYELWLGSVDSNGQAKELRKYFSFTILPPFWQSWWFYILVLSSLAGLIFMIVKWRVAINNTKSEEKNKIDKLISESQITAIRAQMNPHFIFNSINSIQDFVLNNETQQAYDYLAKFAKLIRLVLSNSKENYITLEKEIEWLKIYIELEQLRFKDSFKFHLEIDEGTSNNIDLKIPNMLLQPYIENAIWHGLMPLQNNKKAELFLKFTYTASQLEVIIEDNGVGREYAKHLKADDVHISMGMKLIDDKLYALSKISQQKLSVVVTDLLINEKPTGTRIQILLEL